jgi:hypothetical protein
MDQTIIGAYERFEELAPHIAALIKKPGFGKTHPVYKDLRRWLNICELIAVGINQDAFSERISLDYWGDVLPDTHRDAKEFIEFIRQESGTSESFLELEKLIRKRKWKPRPALRNTYKSSPGSSIWVVGAIALMIGGSVGFLLGALMTRPE